MSDHPAPPSDLVEAAKRFVAQHEWLAESEWAYGTCIWASRAFADELAGARVMYLLGSKISFPDRDEGWRHYPALDPNLFHAACRVGDWYVDLSRRQFDPACPHPYIEHRKTFERSWHRRSVRPYFKQT